MKIRTKFVIGGLVILAAITVISVRGLQEMTVFFYTPGEVLAEPARFQDQTIRIWDIEAGNQLKQLSGHQGAVYSVAFSDDGSLLVSCGADKTMRLWDVRGGRQLKQVFASHRGTSA